MIYDNPDKNDDIYQMLDDKIEEFRHILCKRGSLEEIEKCHHEIYDIILIYRNQSGTNQYDIQNTIYALEPANIKLQVDKGLLGDLCHEEACKKVRLQGREDAVRERMLETAVQTEDIKMLVALLIQVYYVQRKYDKITDMSVTIEDARRIYYTVTAMIEEQCKL